MNLVAHQIAALRPIALALLAAFALSISAAQALAAETGASSATAPAKRSNVQRVYFATFRFGILESSGGLGVDLNFFDDALEISAEIFQFSDSQLPRMRFRVAYEILPTLLILGGADDVLNERTVDFFLGAMLRFDDNDLVSLLPFFGGAVGSAAN